MYIVAKKFMIVFVVFIILFMVSITKKLCTTYMDNSKINPLSKRFIRFEEINKLRYKIVKIKSSHT